MMSVTVWSGPNHVPKMMSHTPPKSSASQDRRWSGGPGGHRGGEQSPDRILDDRHDLVDFVSPDRSRASNDGTSFTPQEWSTPLSKHQDVDGWRVLATGKGRWKSLRCGRPFTYLEINFDRISFDSGTTGSNSRPETDGSTVGCR